MHLDYSRELVNTLPKIGVNFPAWAKGLSTIYQARTFDQEKKEKSITNAQRFEGKQFFKPPQGLVKLETLKPSMVEESSKVNELPQATIEVEESVILHIKEEISNVEHCDLMRDKNIEKESIEIKDKERLEHQERLVEIMYL
ncbi:hypothetical protein M9H77_30291 [Catharanthus roseus]|uniref:Uncharacterized protein n=1 Tax=Catharanthus roseus TaxID=4058 RepID=A0ACB9ZXP2_CATRO|nr:hypothetical protein M9H77_30291 [Catharanthus roseus]